MDLSMKRMPEQAIDNQTFPQAERNIQDPSLVDDEERSFFVEQSPFEEVAANVSNHDDPTMSCFTFRSCLLGISFTCVLAFTNQFFAFRTLPMSIEPLLVQLLAYPFGKLLVVILPTRRFHPFGTRYSFSFNPGPFTIKEHCLITTMASTASNVAQGIFVLAVQRIFYKQAITHWTGLLFILSSQILGFGFVGILRRYLIWPASVVWPRTLIQCALFRAMHETNSADETLNTSQLRTSRFRFFYLALLFQTLWYWIPGFICPVLSYFSLFCMIFPHNVIISQITGANGLGLGTLALDWNSLVSFLGSPIAVPLWAQINIMVGFVLLVWTLTPIAYYSNWWNAKTFPIASYQVFNKEGYFYNVTNILDSQLKFNETAYQSYGPVYLSFLFAMNYGVHFTAITAILVHTLLYEGTTLYQQYRASLTNIGGDIHAKLMTQYNEVPSYWYTILFLATFVVSAIVCHHGQLMPWYFLFVAVFLVLIFILPTGMLLATSSMSFGINVVSEFIAGILIPGKPIANIVFKAYAYGSQIQAISLLENLKYGHYMKIPPRTMFLTQILATMITSLVNYIVAMYLIDHVPHICTPNNVEWKCPKPTTFYSASIIWGVIGPTRMFGPSSLYFPLLCGFPLGAILPIPAWLLIRKYPTHQWLKYIHFPVLLCGVGLIPTAPAGEYLTWFIVGAFFNFVLFRYAHAWWKQYAFLFSAAMSCGVAISGILIFFVFQNNDIHFPKWWGTGGITGDGCPLANGNFSGDLPSYKRFDL
ncbi:unnamed protein product [Adineta ricciae]|uniref:Uncharacterized protein n=1 Tax=Adineta ricciae TaxID=249248 RepID=A0A814SWD9_ADIRI|nr:unnamed protein product [Adineta ricciae]CAF1152732.1 unnamed protein product [Adineta ricciae]